MMRWFYRCDTQCNTGNATENNRRLYASDSELKLNSAYSLRIMSKSDPLQDML